MYRWLSYIITAILDGKLDSVPGIAQSVAGLGQPTPPAGPGISPDPPAQNVSQTDNPKPTSQEPEIVAVVESAPVEKGIRETVLSSHGGGNIWFSVKTLCEDERYSKYFKMLKMGVPLQVRFVSPHKLYRADGCFQAVKNKMAVEGLDVAVLDHPDQPVPGGEDRAETVSSAGEESDGWE